MLDQIMCSEIPGSRALKGYFGMVVDKENTPFVHTNNEELLKYISKNIPNNLGLLALLEYDNEVYYCSSTLLKDIATAGNMPNRIIIWASISLNMSNSVVFCLASVLDVKKGEEISKIIDMGTGKEANIPEDARKQLVADILLREGFLANMIENAVN